MRSEMTCPCHRIGYNRIRARTELFWTLVDVSLALSMTPGCWSRRKWISVVSCISGYYLVWSELNLKTLLQDNTSRNTGADSFRRTCGSESTEHHEKPAGGQALTLVLSSVLEGGEQGGWGPFASPPSINHHQFHARAILNKHAI